MAKSDVYEPLFRYSLLRDREGYFYVLCVAKDGTRQESLHTVHEATAVRWLWNARCHGMAVHDKPCDICRNWVLEG